MSNDSEQSSAPAELREDTGPDPLKHCRTHALIHSGVCPCCKLVEEKDRELARLQEKIDQLEGTIDDYRRELGII